MFSQVYTYIKAHQIILFKSTHFIIFQLYVSIAFLKRKMLETAICVVLTVKIPFSSVQFSRSVVSDSLQPHPATILMGKSELWNETSCFMNMRCNESVWFLLFLKKENKHTKNGKICILNWLWDFTQGFFVANVLCKVDFS